MIELNIAYSKTPRIKVSRSLSKREKYFLWMIIEKILTRVYNKVIHVYVYNKYKSCMYYKDGDTIYSICTYYKDGDSIYSKRVK